MCLYIRNAWRAYRDNFKFLIAVSFVLVILGVAPPVITAVIGNIFGYILGEVIGIVAAFLSAIAPVYVYQRLLGTYENAKNTLIQGIFALLARALAGTILIAATIFAIVFLAVSVIGIALIPFAIVAAVILGAKLEYIDYLAAKGNGIGDILKKTWRVRLDVAWRAIAGKIIVSIPIMTMIAILALPMIVYALMFVFLPVMLVYPSTIDSVLSPISQLVERVPVLEWWMNTFIANPMNAILSFILAIIAYTVFAPLIWMFPLVSGKDAVGE